jgi:hypothetical protein
VTDGRHAVAEETSLALHRAVADRLRADPSLVERARRRVEGWLSEGTVARPYAEAWREVLAGPVEDVARFLEDPGDRARQLRQSSPFAGVLNARTRWAIWRQGPSKRHSTVNRPQLEHVIRAAATIADDDEIVVIGSQAILGRHADAPGELLLSMDVDLYPRNHPERADLIEGSIGELSPFHETYGYYAQAAGPATAVLPEGWEARLVPVPTPAGTGLCLETHDLVISKYVAGREKDREYVRAAVRHRLVDRATLLERLARTPVDEGRRGRVSRQIEADFAAQPLGPS